VTTISIKEDTRQHLLRVAADLQKAHGQRVDFDATIRYLITLYEQRRVDLKAWEAFTQPLPGLTFDDLYQELVTERQRDDAHT
jgi:hypothetical protein